MTTAESEFYFERDLSAAHDDPIPARKDNIDTTYSALVQRVFDHQHAVFDRLPIDGPLPITPQRALIPTRDMVAHRFYKKHYVHMKIRAGRGGRRILTPRRLLEEIALPRTNRTRNNLFYLLGGVGRGKSTLINYLITNHGYEILDRRRTWFLAVDIFLSGNNEVLSYDNILDAIIAKLLTVVEQRASMLQIDQYLTGVLQPLQNYSKLTTEEKESQIQKYILAYHEVTGNQLFLIIDNLDYLYHCNDRETFTSENLEYRETVRTVSKLMSNFFHDSTPLGAEQTSFSLCGMRVMRSSYSQERFSKISLCDSTFTRMSWRARIGRASMLQIDQYLTGVLQPLQNYSKLTTEEKESQIQKYILAYHEVTGNQLFLIIDNLDYLYHCNDRETFTSENLEYRETVRTVSKLMSNFFHDSTPLGRRGANVLFSLRNESYEILLLSREILKDFSLRFDFHAYVVESPNSDVLAERGALLEWAIAKVPTKGRRDAFQELYQPLKNEVVSPAVDTSNRGPQVQSAKPGTRLEYHLNPHFQFDV